MLLLYRRNRLQLCRGIGRVNKSDGECILFFVKYPEKGQVKKRLSAELDEEVIVELYKNFILDSLSTLGKCEVQFLVCFYPADSQNKFTDWLGTYYSYLPQQGSDLGQRMKNGFINTFDSNFHQVIIIGSDSPDLPGDFIKKAFLSLKTHDVVIGPSFDGGYYLIGFRYNTFLPEAFSGIDWGTNMVFGKTLDIFKKAGRKIHILPKWHDVDTYADLNDLIARNKDTEFHYSKTISYLSEISGILR